VAFVHGKAASILFGAVDLSSIFKGADLAIDVDVADTSTFGFNYKTMLAGQGSSTLDLDGFYDIPLSANLRNHLFVAPAPATFGPGGLAVGDLARLIAVHETNYTESAAIGDAMLATASLMSDAEVGFGVSLRAPNAAAVTATGNGTSVDLAAAVTGATWVFHAHVFTASGTTPSLTLKIQDSADNSTFADVTSAVTSAFTAAGSARVTGTGTIRRYVRVVHTISGTTPSFTYSAAFARRA